MEKFESLRAESIIRQERQAELAPLLGKLILDAKHVYRLLRPKAMHVSEVGLDYPLRHQQVHGVSVSGLRQIGDYLMIRPGEHDNITIQQQQSVNGDWLWSIDHTKQIGDLMSDQTHIAESSNGLLQPQKRINMRTGIYEYPEKWGHNSYFRRDSCDYYDGYPDAEARIEAIAIDFEAALQLHS